MNTTKIEWTDKSWNPVTGCAHGCWYCYAKRMFKRFGKSFEPTFYPERLNQIDKIKKPCKIFVGSVSDIFAGWTKEGWRKAVIDKICDPKYKHITFQLLTKQPQNISKIDSFPSNIWIGCTVNDKTESWKIAEMRKVKCKTCFISFEPLLGSMGKLNLSGIGWIIIGKITGAKKAPFEEWWVDEIWSQALLAKVPTFMKNNLKSFWHRELIQEFPK